MPDMRGLTLIAASGDAERFRTALTIACAAAALGGRVRLFAQERAVPMLVARDDPGDDALIADGLPTRAALLATATESGVNLIACQTGLAIARLTPDDLVVGSETGGLVGLLADLGDDRLDTV
jgi:peroxiredoxin family protein